MGQPVSYINVETPDGWRLKHHLVWEQANGPIPEGLIVDHINGNHRDNRLENLRLATPSENQWNRKLNRNSRTGVKGLSWDKTNSRWQCNIACNGSARTFKTKNLLDAVAWLLRTRVELHGEFARFD